MKKHEAQVSTSDTGMEAKIECEAKGIDVVVKLEDGFKAMTISAPITLSCGTAQGHLDAGKHEINGFGTTANAISAIENAIGGQKFFVFTK